MATAKVFLSSEGHGIPSGQDRRFGLLSRLSSIARFFIAVILCLTPLTAVLVLGWLMRLMRQEENSEHERLQNNAKRRKRVPLPRWVKAEALSPSKGMSRWLGSFSQNLKLGVRALITLALGTLPFTLLWLFSWWGGWENSFNKGYEQAWVGPITALIGIAISLPLLTRLPMALAHQAALGSMSGYFAWREVSSLIRAAGWRYILLAFLIVLAALPLFLAKAAPVFVEQWSPGFTGRNAEEIKSFAQSYQVFTSVYLVAVLVWLRRSAARLHAFAAIRLEVKKPSHRVSNFLSGGVRTAILWFIWFGLVAQIYVGQFINHQWVYWLNHPILVIPWIPPLGAAL